MVIFVVYCPKCGRANDDKSSNCINCGEILSEETRFIKIVKAFDILGLIFGILFFVYLIGIYFDLIPSKYYLGFFIILILALLFLSKRAKRVLEIATINLFFGGLKSVECPECEELVSGENYCFNCGYKISDVKGYYQIGSYQPTFIEVNRKYLRVFESFRARYELVRLDPSKYLLANIKDPRVEWCQGKILTHPCFKFSYSGRRVVLPINAKILSGIQQNLNYITGPLSIGGPFNWIRNQNKVRFGITIGVILAFIIAGTVYFTYSTDISYGGFKSQVSGLEVVSATGFKHISTPNSVTVEGYIKNNGNTDQDFVKVNIIGHDSSGNIVSQDATYIEVDTLKPGETSFFYNYLDDYQQNIRSFKVEVFV